MNMKGAKLNGAYILVATLFLIYSLGSYGAKQTTYNITLDGKAIGGVQIKTTKVCGKKSKLEREDKPTDEQEEKSKSTEKIISEQDVVQEDLVESQKWHWEQGEGVISLLTDKGRAVSCIEYLYYFNHALEHLGQMLNLQVQGVEEEDITVTTSGMGVSGN